MTQSILRTLVPIIYALLIKVGLDRLGIEEEEIQNLATVITAALVYIALRLAETLQPKLGWLLGFPVAPTYVPTGTPVAKGEESDLASSADSLSWDPSSGDL